jgi:glycosyltransferase involved in cell wall biosynthesis
LEIICLGFAEWDTELWTNQHHLMARLATRNRILFIESIGLRTPQVAARDVKRMAGRLVRGLRRPRVVKSPFGGEILVLAPLILPFHRSAIVRKLNGVLLRRFVKSAARRAFSSGSPRRRVLWGYVPQAEALLATVDPDLVVYHCVDDIARQDGVDFASYRDAEKRYLAASDLVLASAPALWERLEREHFNVLRAPNVADTELFASALAEGPVDPEIGVLGRPRIVFTGAIAAKKLDLELIAQVAFLRPDWQLALVGGIGVGDPLTDVRSLQAAPNIHFIETRKYSDLPKVLRGADVGIIPYRRSALTESIFPMKVYEYLAAGLPVVATALPSLGGVPDVVTVAAADEMVVAIEQALRVDASERHLRSARAASHSWDGRIAEIGEALQKLSNSGGRSR